MLYTKIVYVFDFIRNKLIIFFFNQFKIKERVSSIGFQVSSIPYPISHIPYPISHIPYPISGNNLQIGKFIPSLNFNLRELIVIKIWFDKMYQKISRDN